MPIGKGEPMARFANMKARLARLAGKGLRVAPTVDSPKGIKRGGHFRIYGEDECSSMSGTTAVLKDTISKLFKGETTFIQRLPCSWCKFEYVFHMTTRDTLSGDPTPAGTFRTSPDVWGPAGNAPSDLKGHIKSLLRSVEQILGDIFDVEVGFCDGKPIVLSAVPAPRTFRASLRSIVSLVASKSIREEEAILRLPSDVFKMSDRIDAPAESAIATGIPAAPGIAIGKAAWGTPPGEGSTGKPILVVGMTTPEHVEALKRCAGIITRTGGFTSHAAVIARQMGLPCIVSASGGGLDGLEGQDTILSMDGNTGRVFAGTCALKKMEGVEMVDTLLQSPKAVHTLKVYGNADTPADVKKAIEFGATGIGLCRTEHQFFSTDRINVMRRLLLAVSPEDRRKALSSLLAIQRTDFAGMLEAAKGLPVTIRLLDAPLHEFLSSGDVHALASETGVSASAITARINELHEENPMLGYRGCRVGIVTPDIYAMQTQAIAEATKYVSGSHPQVMIPLIATVREFAPLRALVEDILTRVLGKERAKGIPIGTMIETPRACVTADELAKHADFFSFGTNDLTQMTWGFSRDDIGKFLPAYREKEILTADPFESLDVRGVGRLIRMAVELGLTVKPDLKVGICGEHGGDPRSIVACANLGMHYVSCSPFRIKTARLAAVQIHLRSKA